MRILRAAAALLALPGLWTCGLPTEAPRWDQTWVVPVERIRIGVAELLPDSIELNTDTTAFVARVAGAAVELSLAELCGSPCVLAAGMRVPKPAFRDTLRVTTTLPADLISATMAGGAFDGSLAHSFNFDPLRPSADSSAERGNVVTRITSRGNVIAFDSIDGATRAFPAANPLVPSLDVRPVEVGDTVRVEVAVYSPAGDSTTIDPTDTLGVTLARSAVQISRITIAATGIRIDSVSTTLAFGDVDSTTTSRIGGGALRLRVQNPFAVTGELNMAFRGDFQGIEQTLVIEEGTYVRRLAFTGDEVRDILHSDSVDLVSSGNVAAGDGILTLRPRDALILDAEFEINVLLGPLDTP